jgi:hypothetical protein
LDHILEGGIIMLGKRLVSAVCLFVLCLALVGQAQGPENVALLGTATLSTTYSADWGPGMAIDGNVNTGAHSSAVTADEWLEIALDQPYDLTEIRVVNRANCCDERMLGNIIVVMDADRNVLYTSDPFAELALGCIHTFEIDGAGFAGASIFGV